MVNQRQILSIVCLSLLLQIGCSRPNPTPELIDPIYRDIGEKAALSKAEADRVSEEIKTAKEELEKLPPRDPSLRKMRQDLKNKEAKLVQLEQQALYYEIRAEKRKAYAREDYLKAFNAGKPWPNPETKEAYELVGKLRAAPREWSKSVPKTDRYNRKSIEETRKEIEEKAKAASKGGGGEKPAH